jgi:hypothetical protein
VLYNISGCAYHSVSPVGGEAKVSQITSWYMKGINFDDAPSSLIELEQCGVRVDLERTELIDTPKWEPRLQGKREVVTPGWVPLDSLATFRRGIATGANGFFLLSKDTLAEIGISIDRCFRCIGRASDVAGLIYRAADFETAVTDGGKLYLLNLSDPLTEAERRYVNLGDEQGLTSRFLLANRRPWYSMEQRSVAPIWAAVFGRGDLKFVFNEAGVRSLTNFHCIYPKVSDINLQMALTLCLNTNSVRESSKLHGRVYGGGLNKFEPNDLKSIQVPDLSRVPSNTLINMANLLRQLNANPHNEELRRTADELCSTAGQIAALPYGHLEEWCFRGDASRLMG